MNCQTVKPPMKERRPDVQRCEHCWEPKRLAFIACVHPNVPDEAKIGSKPICGADYLFTNVIPAPYWCPLKNGDNND